MPLLDKVQFKEFSDAIAILKNKMSTIDLEKLNAFLFKFNDEQKYDLILKSLKGEPQRIVIDNLIEMINSSLEISKFIFSNKNLKDSFIKYIERFINKVTKDEQGQNRADPHANQIIHAFDLARAQTRKRDCLAR